MKAALPPRDVMLLAGKSFINLAKFGDICIRREPNTRHAVLINPYYATIFSLVGTLSIGISHIYLKLWKPGRPLWNFSQLSLSNFSLFTVLFTADVVLFISSFSIVACFLVRDLFRSGCRHSYHAPRVKLYFRFACKTGGDIVIWNFCFCSLSKGIFNALKKKATVINKIVFTSPEAMVEFSREKL